MTQTRYSSVALWAGGATSIVHASKKERFNGTSPVVIGIPGHGSSPAVWDQGGLHGQHLQALARAGCIVLVIDQLNLWGNDARMTELSAAVDYARSTLGGHPTDPVGFYGMSAGGCDALNFTKRNPEKVKSLWLFCPATDLDYLYGVGYAVELDAAYGGNYGANKAGHVPLADAAVFPDLPVHIAQGGSDPLVLPATTATYAAAIGATLEVAGTATHTDVPHFTSPSRVVEFLL